MRVIRMPRWLVSAVCVCVAIMAGLVLAGWLLGVAGLTTLGTGVIAMKPNTAVGLLLAAGALFLVARPGPARGFHLVGGLLGLAVFALGALTLLSHIAEMAWPDVAVPEVAGWLFPELADPLPLRMAWITAAELCALGLAIALLAVPRRWVRSVGQMLAALVAFVGLLSAFGYAVDLLVPADGAAATALHSGIGVLLLGVGALVVHPDVRPVAHAMADDEGGLLTRRLLPAVIGIPLTIGWLLGDRLGPATSLGVVIFAAASIVLLVIVVLAEGASLSRMVEVRQRAEDALRVNAQIVAELPIGLEVWRLEAAAPGEVPVARLVASNPGAAEATGVPRHEVIGRRMDEIPYGLYLGRLRAALDEVAEHHRPVRVGDIAIHGSNAPPKVLSAAAFPLPDGSVGVSLEDITVRRLLEAERARSDEELRRTLAMLDATVESIPAMVYLKDAATLSFARMNRAGLELLGLTSEAVVGKDDFAVFAPEEAASFRASDREVLDTKKLVEVPAEPIQTARGVRWLHTRKVPILDDAGQPRFILAIAQDITQRWVADAELRAAKESAEAANRELEAFSYSVAHDLRGPLRTIDGFSQALEEELGPRLEGEPRRNLRFVREASERMLDLIDDLLMLSRITRQELARETVDLTALARATVARLQQADPTRVVAIDVQPGMTARADRRLLAIVLDNLVGNAWKFTSRSATARIAIGAEHGQGPPTFFVRDNGAGFDMTHAGKLFGVFQRLHGGDEYEGTGIGLATVMRIVRRHGGKVWADARPGAGATFSFTLEDAA